jgi:hypothetical protein
MARVAGEIPGHGLVGVQPDLAETRAARLFLSQCEQPGADPAALGCGQDGRIVQQQMARLGHDDGKADDLPVLEGSPRLPVADRLRIVSGHRPARRIMTTAEEETVLRQRARGGRLPCVAGCRAQLTGMVQRSLAWCNPDVAWHV